MSGVNVDSASTLTYESESILEMCDKEMGVKTPRH